MDDVFHGYNPADALEPSREVTQVDTLMHCVRKTHGDFQTRYSDTVLPTHASWSKTGGSA